MINKEYSWFQSYQAFIFTNSYDEKQKRVKEQKIDKRIFVITLKIIENHVQDFSYINAYHVY